MNRTAVIAIDIGTSSLRAVLFDHLGHVVTLARRDSSPLFLPGGQVEQDCSTWADLVPDVVRACADAARTDGLDVAALAITAQRSSIIPVDSDGRPLRRAIMWQDTRTRDICERLANRSRRVYEVTGLRLTPVFSAVKMTWLRENEPEVFDAAYKMIGIQDFVIRNLTGSWVIDRSLASRTNLYNLRTGDWDGEMMDIFGVNRSMLCDLIDPGDIAGVLTADAADRMNLASGIPVISAGGDQQCAALGLGLTGPGRMIANTGTGSYLITSSKTPAADPGMGISCNVAAVPGTFILEAGIVTSGSVYSWFRERFYPPSEKGTASYAEIDSEASSSPPGSRGVVLLPHFKGRGSPSWNPSARGAFLNLTPEVGRGDMARSILEGIALEIAENMEAMESLGAGAQVVQVSGGMTRSPLFNRIQADCYGRTVERSDDAEATALGAWMSAAVRIGIYPSFESVAAGILDGRKTDRFEPDPANRQTYLGLLEERRRLYEGINERN